MNPSVLIYGHKWYDIYILRSTRVVNHVFFNFHWIIISGSKTFFNWNKNTLWSIQQLLLWKQQLVDPRFYVKCLFFLLPVVWNVNIICINNASSTFYNQIKANTITTLRRYGWTWYVKFIWEKEREYPGSIACMRKTAASVLLELFVNVK